MDNRTRHCQSLSMTVTNSNATKKSLLSRTMAKTLAKTLGGLFYWRDVAIAHDWRVQVHVRKHTARVLDPQDQQIFSGSEAECRARFYQATQNLPARRHVVMIVHPLAGNRYWMGPTQRKLRANGFHTESFGYASLLEDVPTHAAALDALIAAWDDVETLSFVTLSLGGVVVAHVLARVPAWVSRIKVASVVMMGPPAQGAALARIGMKLAPARALVGPALPTLAAEPMPTIGFRDIPVLIIAGQIPIGNPLLRGADDGVVLVSETRIDVPHTHLIVRAYHASIQRNKQARAALIDFILEHRAKDPGCHPGLLRDDIFY
jgi:pimeloyl-ACP methyl ester carboxylesterase